MAGDGVRECRAFEGQFGIRRDFGDQGATGCTSAILRVQFLNDTSRRIVPAECGRRNLRREPKNNIIPDWCGWGSRESGATASRCRQSVVLSTPYPGGGVKAINWTRQRANGLRSGDRAVPLALRRCRLVRCRNR